MVSGDTSVLFVVLDTVRKDRLNPYGYERRTTPSLDAFAEEATVYDSAISQAPWTLPVHASLFTGLYPGEHGAGQERPYLDGPVTLASALGAAGYATACYSSNTWITPYTGLTAGFDDADNFFEVLPGDLLAGPLATAWQYLNDRPQLRTVANRLVDAGNRIHERLASGEGADSKTPAVVDRTRAFVDACDGPFFAFVNLMDAHLPYYPPTAYRERFAPGVDPTTVCQNAKEYNARARSIDDDEWASIRGLYDAEIAHADAELGRLFEWLRVADRWEETTVIVCADHGELHGEHDLYGHEFAIYEPLVNVPLLVKHPDLGHGRVDEQLELLDLYHTVLDATVPAAAEHVGAVPFDPTRSLLRDEHRAFDGGEYAFVEYDRPVIELAQLESKASRAGLTLAEDTRYYSRMRAVRRPDGKYIQNERIPDEFYRLDEGGAERSNRRDRGDPIEDELRGALATFVDRTGSTWGDDAVEGDGLAGMGAAQKRRLRDLGYLE